MGSRQSVRSLTPSGELSIARVTRAGRFALTAAAAIAAALALAALHTALQRRRAERAFPPSGSFVTVDGVRLHYVSAGAGQPVVLLHGNPGFVRVFAPGLVDSLAPHFRVLALDRPGHGYSERPAGPLSNPEGQARLLHGALRKLEVERPVLVGHSWGGALALLYTLEYPEEVAGLVLLAPRAFPLGGGPDPLYALLRAPLLGALVRHTVLPPLGRHTLERRLGAAYAPDLPQPEHRAAARALWLRPGQVAATAWDSHNLNEQLREVSARYDRVTAPVIILVGDADRPEREAVPLGRAIPGAELLVLPGTGHQIPQTRPRAVLEAVERTTELRGPR